MAVLTKKCKRTAIGLVTGFANGLFGSGGGTIVVPAMERFLGEEEHKAHATAIAAIGFFSGIISGMGIGGGTILIPALLFLTEVNQQQAQGVNLIYFIPTAVVALITHRKNGTLDLKTAKPLALLGLAGAAAGAFLAVSLESEILKKLFGAFLLLMGLSEILQEEKRRGYTCKEMVL